MVEKNKRRFCLRSRKLPLHVYLAYLLVCTLVTTGISFSRYATADSGTTNLQVKGFAVTAGTYGNSGNLSINCNTQQTAQSYAFTVSGSSGVTVHYDVIVKLNQALPTGISLTLDGNDASWHDGSSYVFSGGTFQAGTSGTNTHTLTITADPSILNEEASVQVSVSVQAEQTA